MYVELITRITTQPLDDADGDEETALNSVLSVVSNYKRNSKE
ncbi:MAG: hypothetical protein ACLUGJ_14190 [Blautia wexlerae]